MFQTRFEPSAKLFPKIQNTPGPATQSPMEDVSSPDMHQTNDVFQSMDASPSHVKRAILDGSGSQHSDEFSYDHSPFSNDTDSECSDMNTSYSLEEIRERYGSLGRGRRASRSLARRKRSSTNSTGGGCGNGSGSAEKNGDGSGAGSASAGGGGGGAGSPGSSSRAARGDTVSGIMGGGASDDENDEGSVATHCPHCGKEYRQNNSFYKHLYEHHPYWNTVSKDHNLSKHQQVLLMQSAELLLSLRKPQVYGLQPLARF